MATEVDAPVCRKCGHDMWRQFSLHGADVWDCFYCGERIG